jgi:type IV pilus assembly protein PilY1
MRRPDVSGDAFRGSWRRRGSRRWSYLHAAGISAAGAFWVAPSSAQPIDTNPPVPNVLILLDTSGTMEKMIDDTMPEASPASRCNDTGAAVTPNRWGTAVQSLTGDFGTYSCVDVNRKDATFLDELTLGGQPPADASYYLDWHRPSQPITGDASHVCVIGHDKAWPATASPNPPQVNSDFDAARIQGYKLSTTSRTYGTTAADTCVFGQQTNGALDAARDLVRFGLMTYDNDPDSDDVAGPGIGVVVSNASPLTFTQAPNPVRGMWSYFHGWDGSTASLPTHGRPGGCVTDPLFELGARNPAAPPWEGRMIAFPSPTVPAQQAIVNAQVQSAILAARPYGANPIGAMMDDAKWYFWGDASGPKNDAMVTGGCRKQYVILLTHAKPNLDLEPYCEAGGPPTGKCPYDTAENVAYGLQHGQYTRAQGLVPNVESEELSGPNGTTVSTFVIGFALSSFSKPNGQPGKCSDVVNTDGSLNTTICGDPSMQATYGACCTLEKIAINGGTKTAYFADSAAALNTALGAILGSIVNASSTRTTPVQSPTVTGSLSSTGGSTSAVFLSSFTAAANGVPWSGNVQRQRLSCNFQSGSYQPQTQPIDPSKGDDFAVNLNLDHATQRHVLVVQPYTGTGFTTPASAATLRPYVKGPGSPNPSGASFDNLGMYDGTEYEYDYTVTASGSPVTLTEVTPAALGINGNCPITVPGTLPQTAFVNADCAAIALDFALGMQNGPSSWPSAVQTFPGRFYNPADKLPRSAFGDVFHSTPAVVGPPSALLRDDSYQSFVTAYTTQYHGTGDNKPRRTVLYVATNDGLLHAFGTDFDVNDSSTFNSQKNNELWALIPPAAMPNLIKNFPSAHNVLLDGPPVVKDTVFERVTASASTDWHTTLVAGFGGGGPGYYAVDVTDPEVTTRGSHAFNAGHASTNSATTAYAAKTGPHFLWQLTEPSLFGETSATPAITTVFANPGDSGGVREIGVAILPGGGTTAVTGACARAPNNALSGTTQKKSLATPTATGYLPNLTVRRWAAGGCLSAVRGRSLNVVRLDTGEVIRSFMRADTAYEPMVEAPATLLTANSGATGTNNAGYKYIGRVIDTPLDSPMTGTPAVYPSDVGAIGQKVFVSDADGTVWRFDLSNSDPNQWFGEVFLDPFNSTAASATGLGSDVNFPTLGRSPVDVTPVIALGRDGNLVVEVATGKQDQAGSINAYPNFVYSLSEAAQTDPTTSTTRLRAQVNWFKPLLSGEMVTGPMQVFDGVFYFASFAPPASGASACGGGVARLWGMDFTTLTGQSTPPSGGGVARLTDPAQPGTVTQFADQGTAIIPGVTVQASLTCATTDAASSDPYVPGATHAATGNISPATYSLMAQIGKPGATSGGPSVSTLTRALPSPRTSTIVDSWASIVE